MNQDMILFLLAVGVCLLVCVVVYQQLSFRRGTRANVLELSQKLEEILDTGSQERVMIFTDEPSLIALAVQINRLLDERQQVQAEVRRSDLAAKRMLSNISHDMKTPMTVLLGYLEMIRLKGDPQGALLVKVEATAQRMMELITQFFTLAKLEAGDTELTRTTVNLSEICRETVLDFYQLLSQQEIQVDIRLPDSPLFVFSNAQAIQRILSNLISNAIRYGGEGKYLGIVAGSKEDSAFVEVIDKGRGIDAAFTDVIFERLFTMDDSRSVQVQGNGLGLTIAKHLAQQLGGSLYVYSQPYQKTVFTLTVPKGID